MNIGAQQSDMDETAAHAAFQRYAEAKQKADETLDVIDGITAGKAWREFLNAFLGPERQVTPETNVVRFPGRRK